MDNTNQLLQTFCSLLTQQQNTATPTVNNNINHPFVIGEQYFIRTVTYHYTGRLVAVNGKFMIFADAAWIADSGRFRQAIMDGVLSEVEPVDVPMFLNMESIVDAFPWKNKLPREQK